MQILSKISASQQRLPRRGFTLMETLLVVSLIAITTLAIYKTMNNGFKIWDRIQQSFFKEDISIFLAKLSDDLHNCVQLSTLPFEGKKSKIRIPAIISALPDPRSRFAANEYLNQIGYVEYYFDYERHAIIRRQGIYGQALNGQFMGERVLVSGIESLSFHYYQTEGDAPLTEGEEVKGVPSGVKIDLSINDAKGEDKSIRSFVHLPLGS